MFARGFGARAACLALALVASAAIAGCAAVSSPAPTRGDATAGPSDVPGGADQIVLQRTPGDPGCDTIQVGYRSVTFFIDPTSQPNVWAVTNKGGRLEVRWDATFVGGPALDPSVEDKTGAIVARNGDVLPIPVGAWPDLHGHFACPGETSLWVFDGPAN
jgi:hypothetical protein